MRQKQVIAAVNDALLRRRDLSQKEIAEKIGISPSYLSRILADHHSALSIDLLDGLCAAVALDLCEAIRRGQRLLAGDDPAAPAAAGNSLSPGNGHGNVTLEQLYKEVQEMKQRLYRQCPLVALGRQMDRHHEDSASPK